MLFNLAQTLRSLTTSPVSTAVDQAHRMARRRLEAGGVAVLGGGGPGDHFGAANFVLPPDIDPIEVASAIEVKLSAGRGSSSESGNSALSALVMRADGRMIVPEDCIRRLGEGEHDRGR